MRVRPYAKHIFQAPVDRVDCSSERIGEEVPEDPASHVLWVLARSQDSDRGGCQKRGQIWLLEVKFVAAVGIGKVFIHVRSSFSRIQQVPHWPSRSCICHYRRCHSILYPACPGSLFFWR